MKMFDAREAGRVVASVLLSGGAPPAALLEHANVAPGEATVLLRASSDDETYLWDEVRDIADAKGVRLYTMVGRRSPVGPGWMPEDDARRGVTLRSVFPDLANSDLYLCGPTTWLDLVEADAQALGLPEHQIHSERFDW